MTKFCILLHFHHEHQATVGLSIAPCHDPLVRLISNISSRLFCLLYTPKTTTYVRGSSPIQVTETLMLNAAARRSASLHSNHHSLSHEIYSYLGSCDQGSRFRWTLSKENFLMWCNQRVYKKREPVPEKMKCWNPKQDHKYTLQTFLLSRLKPVLELISLYYPQWQTNSSSYVYSPS
jgi:hypothetical protein